MLRFETARARDEKDATVTLHMYETTNGGIQIDAETEGGDEWCLLVIDRDGIHLYQNVEIEGLSTDEDGRITIAEDM